MSKISVLGGSGFIGSHLVSLLDQNSVIILDKQKPSNDINYDNCDITNYEILNLKLASSKSIVLLAAEHRDDVTPTSLYYNTNVNGTKNVIKSMIKNDINHIIFTSTVAVYGLEVNNPSETANLIPFNHYGKSKLEAEKVLIDWYKQQPDNRILDIVRPTVVFGEGNRGNVFNLVNQISSGRFAMVGNGENYKSMAYVGNLVAFIKYLLENRKPGMEIYNYTDKPDLSMNELVDIIEKNLSLSKHRLSIPKSLGLLTGYGFDLISKLLGKSLPISSVRIKKFCANTTFDTSKVQSKTSFLPPYSLSEGLHKTIKYDFIP
tara:strand:- start:576 stop:1532 length:957 start_codon:yes stop_codon:yes gene_type:complete